MADVSPPFTPHNLQNLDMDCGDWLVGLDAIEIAHIREHLSQMGAKTEWPLNPEGPLAIRDNSDRRNCRAPIRRDSCV